MGRVGSVAALALLVWACAPAMEERVHDLNDAGRERFQKGQYDRARLDFQAALKYRPNDAELLYNIGQCYQQLGQSQCAEQTYRLCLQQDANSAKVRHALTVLLVQHGRAAEAQEMVRDWLNRQPKLSAAYAEDGWLYEQEGHFFNALKRYEQAIFFDPGNTFALVSLGQIYEDNLKQPERALKLYQIALDYDPHQPEVVRQVNRLLAQNVGPPR
ncbi:MAG: tetratricopeptide repeat protein, partial [Gemmataceae bacterium]